MHSSNLATLFLALGQLFKNFTNLLSFLYRISELVVIRKFQSYVLLIKWIKLVFVVKLSLRTEAYICVMSRIAKKVALQVGSPEDHEYMCTVPTVQSDILC